MTGFTGAVCSAVLDCTGMIPLTSLAEAESHPGTRSLGFGQHCLRGPLDSPVVGQVLRATSDGLTILAV